MNASNQIRLSLPIADFELSVDLLLPAQGITAIYGASGSGKTSLLRAVAGLERAKHSLIRIAGQTWQDDSAAVFVPMCVAIWNLVCAEPRAWGQTRLRRRSKF